MDLDTLGTIITSPSLLIAAGLFTIEQIVVTIISMFD